MRTPSHRERSTSVPPMTRMTLGMSPTLPWKVEAVPCLPRWSQWAVRLQLSSVRCQLGLVGKSGRALLQDRHGAQLCSWHLNMRSAHTARGKGLQLRDIHLLGSVGAWSGGPRHEASTTNPPSPLPRGHYTNSFLAFELQPPRSGYPLIYTP